MRITKKFIEAAKEAGDVLLSLKLNMDYVKGKQKKGSILNIGEFIYAGRVTPKTAVDIYEAFSAGAEKRLTKDQEMLMDLLDGCKGPGEIKAQTGLPDERCEEIYEFYKNTDRNFWLKPEIKE